MSTVIIFFACFAVAIVLAQKLKVNAGFIAIILGFILTWTIGGESSTTFIKAFPSSLFWNYAIPIIFYAFANGNGTMKVLGTKIAYRFRRSAWAMPIAMMLANALISCLGAGTNSTFIMAPLAWSLCMQCGVKPILVPISIWCGSFVGAFHKWTATGALNYALFDQFLTGDADVMATRMSIYYVLFGIIIYAAVFLLCRGWKVSDAAKEVLMKEPEKFNTKQKITLYTIFGCIALLLVPSVVNQFAPNAVCRWMSSNLSIPTTTAIGISILAITRAADLKEVFSKHVNWNILWTITGMAMYCGLATTLGVVDTLGEVMAGMSGPIVLAFICLVAAALSFVTSASTVQPLLMSLIPTLAVTCGVTEHALVICMMIGVGVTSISPFSTGGAAALIGAPEDVAPKMVNKQILAAICFTVVCVVCAAVGLFSI